MSMAVKTKKKNLKDTVVEAILEKKGKEIIVLGLTELQQSVADYFIICHGDSNVQVDAITNNVERKARTELKEHVIHQEGTENSQWIILDYGDVVVHIFQESFRKFYNLEDLWADAKTELIKEE